MRGVAAGLVLIAALSVPVYFLIVNVPALIGLRLPVDRDSMAGIGLVNDPKFEPTPTPGAIVNTGGIGAAVRAEPRIGGQIAGMREGDVADVLERQTVDGAEWVRVRTSGGQEGWILGRVSERLGPGTPAPVRPTPSATAVGTPTPQSAEAGPAAPPEPEAEVPDEGGGAEESGEE